MVFSAHIARYDIPITWNLKIISGVVVVTSDSRRGRLGWIPWSSQHKILYFHSLTILLASIFSSVLSTYVVVSPCWAS